MCHALKTPFKLEPLDCDPFFHGYEMQCSESKLTTGIWNLSLVDLHGIHIDMPFYLVNGDGYLQVRNMIGSKSKILNNKNLLVIPANTDNL